MFKKIIINIVSTFFLMLTINIANSLAAPPEMQVRINESLDIQDNLSFKYRGKAICESFLPAFANEDTACRTAITNCEHFNQPVLRDVLNDNAVSNPCSHVSVFDDSAPSHWMCPASRWSNIIDFMRNTVVTDEMKKTIRVSCKALSLDEAKSLAPNVFSPVEIMKAYETSTENSVKNKGKEICKSFTKGNITESEVCLSAIEECEKENYPKLLVMLNDAAASPACEDRSVSWLCPSRRWQSIVSDITNGTKDTTKEIVGSSCVPNMASNTGSGSPVSPIPGAPVPGTPVPGDTPPTGSLPGSAPTPPSSGDEAKTSCSMNPLALGNVWSGVLSYLPFFMLMLVFGIKRKNK